MKKMQGYDTLFTDNWKSIYLFMFCWKHFVQQQLLCLFMMILAPLHDCEISVVSSKLSAISVSLLKLTVEVINTEIAVRSSTKRPL